MKKKQAKKTALIAGCMTIIALGIGLFFAFKSSFLYQEGKLSLGDNSSVLQEETPQKSVNASSKIDALRKRYALKGMILDGEAYLKNDQYGLALKNFSQALKLNPSDPFLIERIADTHFEMFKFETAYSTYKRIQNPSKPVKVKTLLSLLYEKKYTLKESYTDIVKEIETLKFSKEEKFYYLTSLSCIHDIHLCKKTFQDYFDTHTEDIKDEKLREVKTSFKNYTNFQIEDVYYKDALLLGVFFTDRMYPLVLNLGHIMNKEKPSYKPVLQMIAQSLYEMGEYKGAKMFLEVFLRYEPDDANGWYLMGVINLKLHEYVLSNIQLLKADGLGYKNTLQIKRRIIYNYYILEQYERMLKELYLLIEEVPGYELSDIYLAIYYHIIYSQIPSALKLTSLGSEKFPNDINLYGYFGWIYKEKGDLSSAQLYLEKGLALDEKNPFILINLGYLYQKEGNIGTAKIYFHKVMKEAPDTIFANQAKEQLDSIREQTKTLDGDKQ